jgi:hypothetical protein
MAGRVLTWDIERQLRSRPLQRGQRLMSVARTDGPWLLEMHVADADVGHLLRAQRETGPELPVTFRLASEPGRVHTGTIKEVSQWAHPRGGEGTAVLVTASVAGPSSPDARPGANATAKITLGRRARAYVWFRDLWEFVRIRAWFWWSS